MQTRIENWSKNANIKVDHKFKISRADTKPEFYETSFSRASDGKFLNRLKRNSFKIIAFTYHDEQMQNYQECNLQSKALESLKNRRKRIFKDA